MCEDSEAMHGSAEHGGKPLKDQKSLALGAIALGVLVLGLPSVSRGESPPGPPASSAASATSSADTASSAKPETAAAAPKPPTDAPTPSPHPAAPVEAVEPAGAVHVGHCQKQEAQAFLIRGNWFPSAGSKEDLAKAKAMQEHAVRYRTEEYGYFEGFGQHEWNSHAPAHYARGTKFMGLPVEVHEKILPALVCVERAIKDNPALLAYHPEALSGLRRKNTYRGGEVSNHVYGIAVDIDPHKNTCCGCVAPWNKNPLCARPAATPYERMAMPKGWVETFERYGFYWLGHDVLRDTMHFEFLGEPEHIQK